MRSANVRTVSKNEEPVVLLGRTQIVMLTNKCETAAKGSMCINRS